MLFATLSKASRCHRCIYIVFIFPNPSTFLLGRLLAFYLFMFFAGLSYSISNDMHVRFGTPRRFAATWASGKAGESKTRTFPAIRTTRAKKSSESSCWASSRFRYFPFEWSESNPPAFNSRHSSDFLPFMANNFVLNFPGTQTKDMDEGGETG